jgi:hypothetical protein
MPDKITPSLESITVRGKYETLVTDFENIAKYLASTLKEDWTEMEKIGSSIELWFLTFEKGEKGDEKVKKVLEERRAGLPFSLTVTAVESHDNGILLEVVCKPIMYWNITRRTKSYFTETQIQEALIECSLFLKKIMSGLRGKWIEPVSVHPVIQRQEIKSRLLNLGLKETVDHLDKAERHIVQNNFEESLKSSRTAFEKMIDWEMKKRGLGETNNYKNNLERLKSKGFIDPLTTELIQTYYRCLSNIAVHAKGEVPPGFFEAQMGYGITLIMLQYFADKLP